MSYILRSCFYSAQIALTEVYFNEEMKMDEIYL